MMIQAILGSDGLRRCCLALICALVLTGQVAIAQVRQIVVGITPACPYGFAACWAGAKEGLGSLEGVDITLLKPDYENCTAELQLKSGEEPNLFQWAAQFRRVVGQIYAYRGIEVTMVAYLMAKNGSIVLQSPFLKKTVTVVPLRHKLQWDFRKAAPQPITAVEQQAYRQAVSLVRRTRRNRVPILVTGPLFENRNQLALELRTFSTRVD